MALFDRRCPANLGKHAGNDSRLKLIIHHCEELIVRLSCPFNLAMELGMEDGGGGGVFRWGCCDVSVCGTAKRTFSIAVK